MASHKASPIALHLKKILEEDFVEVVSPGPPVVTAPRLKAVYYGDQATIPKTPAVCVESANVQRTLAGIPFRTENQFEIILLLYMAGLDGTQNIQLACDQLAEDIADFINADALPEVQFDGTRFGGLITHGHVTSIEYGYSIKGTELLRANRLTVACLSKTGLI